MSGLPDRISDLLTTYSKTVIVVMLVLTAVMGVGAGMVSQDSDTGQFETGSEAADAQEYIQQNFATGDAENLTRVQLVQRGGNTLSKESLIESLEFQKQLREQESIRSTLAGERPTVSVANVIAQTRLQQQARARSQQSGGTQQSADGNATQGGATTQQRAAPTLDEQIAAIEGMSQAELAAVIGSVLDEGQQALRFMPTGYEPGSPTAEAHLMVVTQRTGGGTIQSPDGLGERITNTQLEIRDLASQQDSEYTVFGVGIITDEINRSLGDSMAIVGPLALFFVVVALTVAYRDVLDILLGVFGIIAVLVWTFGFMGWADISFNQLLISVPVLLIGLSIDYAIHVFMRHREQRAESDGTEDLRRSMSVALAGVGTALVWVTATGAIGFLANLTSPIGPLRDFGITSAFGVFAALVIFGALVPALKVEIDGVLEARGFDRQKRAFGTGGSRFSSLLSVGARAARRFPLAIVAVTLLLTLGGAYGATQVDTSFEQTDFLADEPPGWTQNLPGPLQPGEYQIKQDIEYISANFQQEGNEGEILLRGDVTNEQTLQWIAAGTESISEKESVFRGADGQPDIRTPLTVMQRTAAENPESEFAAQFDAAAGADGVPDTNVEQLFDSLLATNPEASGLFYRTEDGEYEALRMVVGVRGDASSAEISDDMTDGADEIEAISGGAVNAVATGDQVVFAQVEEDLFATVLQGLMITLVSVFIFLAVAYRLTGSPASLGVVTLLPVLFAVSWILGSMWLLGISFNTLTGTITSLTIGLGIAYSIHISSRYELELRRQGDVWDAMETTVTGTGGALLGSAATTVGGFGTLAFAIFPVLQQFGIITGLTIIYAFLASVLILPSLLVLWTRYLGPSGYFPGEPDEETPEGSETTAAGDAD